jgi:hypothetical protein
MNFIQQGAFGEIPRNVNACSGHALSWNRYQAEGEPYAGNGNVQRDEV